MVFNPLHTEEQTKTKHVERTSMACLDESSNRSGAFKLWRFFVLGGATSSFQDRKNT